MPRQICLAQPVSTNSRDKASSRTFSIIERAPIRMPEHQEIWETLQKLGEERLVVDKAHPEEAFPAKVIETATLPGRPELGQALSRTRDAALNAERKSTDKGVLAADLDHTFDQQREWLLFRAVLAQATRAKKGAKRTLLLLDC